MKEEHHRDLSTMEAQLHKLRKESTVIKRALKKVWKRTEKHKKQLRKRDGHEKQGSQGNVQNQAPPSHAVSEMEGRVYDMLLDRLQSVELTVSHLKEDVRLVETQTATTRQEQQVELEQLFQTLQRQQEGRRELQEGDSEEEAVGEEGAGHRSRQRRKGNMALCLHLIKQALSQLSDTEARMGQLQELVSNSTRMVKEQRAKQKKKQASLERQVGDLDSSLQHLSTSYQALERELTVKHASLQAHVTSILSHQEQGERDFQVLGLEMSEFKGKVEAVLASLRDKEGEEERVERVEANDRSKGEREDARTLLSSVSSLSSSLTHLEQRFSVFSTQTASACRSLADGVTDNQQDLDTLFQWGRGLAETVDSLKAGLHPGMLEREEDGEGKDGIERKRHPHRLPLTRNRRFRQRKKIKKRGRGEEDSLEDHEFVEEDSIDNNDSDNEEETSATSFHMDVSRLIFQTLREGEEMASESDEDDHLFSEEDVSLLTTP